MHEISGEDLFRRKLHGHLRLTEGCVVLSDRPVRSKDFVPWIRLLCMNDTRRSRCLRPGREPDCHGALCCCPLPGRAGGGFLLRCPLGGPGRTFSALLDLGSLLLPEPKQHLSVNFHFCKKKRKRGERKVKKDEKGRKSRSEKDAQEPTPWSGRAKPGCDQGTLR